MVAIPAILILMLILGVNIGSYQGISVSDAWQQAQATHNYTCSEEEFDKAASQYINNPDFADEIITAGMILDANRTYMTQNVFDYFVESGGVLYEEINGSFDNSWEPSVEARTIKVYDGSGIVLVGSTTIIGIVDHTIPISSHQSTRPDLINKSGYFNQGYLLFLTVDQVNGTYYHTQLDGILNGSPYSANGLAINSFNYQYWYNNTADNVSFVDTGSNYFPLQLIYQGNVYTTSGQFASPVQGQGDISGDTQYIGTATLPDGTQVGVNPDGSITLPDGTTVYRDPVTGLYPQNITVDFPQDWWADFAERIGQIGATSSASDATQQMQWDITGLRDVASSIYRYLTKDMWVDFGKTFSDTMVDLFNWDFITDDLDDLDNPDDDGKIMEVIRKICYNFGIEV